MRIAPENAAWLAGYIDGDGCICLGSKPGYAHRSPLLIIDSADRELLDHVASLVGGTLTIKKKYQAHHRQCWSWRLLGSNNVIFVLNELLPYLRCAFKAERARMLINEWRACTPRNGAYSAELAARKSEFQQRFLAIGTGRGKRAGLPPRPANPLT